MEISAVNVEDTGISLRRKLTYGGIFFALMIIVSLPTVILLCVGMLPTFVAVLIDRTDQKFAASSVGGLNFGGVFPYILPLWLEDHSVDAAVNSISDIFSLMVMYSGAGFGWLIFLAIPPVITAFITVIDETNLKQLKVVQRQIVDEWGDDIASVETEAEAATREATEGEGEQSSDQDGDEDEDDEEDDDDLNDDPDAGGLAPPSGF